MDTIFALSSGAPPAGVAVVRVSGPGAKAALREVAGRVPPPRRAVLRRLRDGAGGVIDDALVLWFPGPKSFTGEDVAEFHLHGGPAVVAALLEVLGRFDGLRQAEAGEFTRRAFEAGRIDLTAAEALADLIDATTEAQRRQALRQAEGALAARYEGWRAALIEAMALVEAEIDFSDEELPGGLRDDVRQRLDGLIADIAAHLDDGHRGERLREGVRVALIGPPNAGKSSILNRLAKRDVAIVSAMPGTTRDVLEVHLDLAGYPVIVSDTAGLRQSADEIEAEGVRRARAAAQDADIRVYVYDAAEGAPGDVPAGSIRLANKTDVLDAPPEIADGFAVSAKTGAGFADWLAALGEMVARNYNPGEAAPLTRARHRRLLEEALDALKSARDALEGEAVLAGEELRRAAHALGRLTGRVDVEDVLDQIFGRFCIGK